jgi:predicted NBD/HSP70 family sugar kinase
MCTSIIEIARAEGMAKRGDEWFPLSQAVVAYDHARHAPLGDVITLDFINTALDPGARAGIELTLETAKELRAALDRAIAAAEFEEAEVRGKGAVLRSFGQRDTRDERVARASAATLIPRADNRPCPRGPAAAGQAPSGLVGAAIARNAAPRPRSRLD